MHGLGEKLRRQRLAGGIELSQIASETRISVRYLQALETGDSKVLPGSLFARNFARQYARFVGLTDTEIEDDLLKAFPPEDVPLDLSSAVHASSIQIAPLPEVVGARLSVGPQLIRSAAVLALAVAGCSAMYVGWQRWYTTPVETAADVPPAEDAEAGAPAAQASAPPVQAPPQQSAAVADPDAQPPGPSTSIELAVPPGAPESGMAVRVVASKATWVSIKVNGQSVYRGTLKPNESRLLPRVAHATMIIGNAGGVDVITDGKSIGPIGPPGQVRVVVLSPEGPKIFKSGTDSPAPADPDGRT